MNASMDIRNLIEPEEHRKLAASFFNETWRLLNLTNRSDAQDRQMIHCAHASRTHWELSSVPPFVREKLFQETASDYMGLFRPDAPWKTAAQYVPGIYG